MSRRNTRACVWAAAACMVLLARGADPPMAEGEPRQKAGREGQAVTGTPILWRDPGDIAVKDLSWKGRSHQAPQAPFTFLEEDTSGTKPKVLVRDANGTTWNVKLSGTDEAAAEVHAEIAAGRLTWALGYLVEESYFVESGRIEGTGKLDRAASSIRPDGSFTKARFEKRPGHVVRSKRRWTFDRNPFVGTKQLSGLMILTTLLNNWDNGGDRNTIVLQVRGENGAIEDWHVVSDLGASFGRMGSAGLIRNRNRWSLPDYREQAFLDGVQGDLLDLHYRGDGRIDMVPLADARWFAERIGQLRPEQVREAFVAAGATTAEIEGFSARVLEKIRELQATTTSGLAKR